MNDAETTVAQLSRLVLDFSKERDWEQFHNPKDLTLALVCEVAEILEHFRYRSAERIAGDLKDPAVHREVSHELADCLWLILRLGEVCKVDLASALEEKIGLAAIKYPVEKCFGRAEKYTHYEKS